ncbi:MAG: glycosyltransferase family 4 protein [Acidobacteria bacterium]|nr:glycosyltransferase family 4 protein [Acidobacteriota bacterium]
MNRLQLIGANGWIVAQIGAREHYALPRALERLGALGRLYTDAWAGLLLRRARFGPDGLRALANRYHREVPSDKVTAFNARGLQQALERSRRRGQPQSVEEQFQQFIVDGRGFALRVNRHLEQHWHRIRPAGMIGYDTGCLETQQLLAERGVPTIVDQIDPGRCEEEIVYAEAAKWPGWQAMPGRIPEAYFERLEEEWRLATRVVVNSEWSKAALIRQGVPEGKLVVVPLCYESPAELPPRPEVGSGRTKTVLWLGQVVLRKGIQYLFEAAKMLADRPLRFVVAGPIGISQETVASTPKNMQFIGAVTRDHAVDLYRSADLFVLPTLSDGFALTQLEAMAHGLPVITTPNCGRVVSDGEDGRIVPAGDAEALAAAIEEMVSDAARLRTASRRAVATAARFSLAELTRRLDTVLAGLACPRPLGAVK